MQQLLLEGRCRQGVVTAGARVGVNLLLPLPRPLVLHLSVLVMLEAALVLTYVFITSQSTCSTAHPGPDNHRHADRGLHAGT